MVVSCELVSNKFPHAAEVAGPRARLPSESREPVVKKGRQHQVQEFWVTERRLCVEGVEEARESISGACQIHQGPLGLMLYGHIGAKGCWHLWCGCLGKRVNFLAKHLLPTEVSSEKG